MWLQTQTENENLKQNAQQQDADTMHALPQLYKKTLKAIFQQFYVSWEDRRNSSERLAPNASTEASAT